MKKLWVIFIIVFNTIGIVAQRSIILTQVKDSVFIEHTIEPKQSLTFIFREYNAVPKDVANFNKIDIKKPNLSIGQKIKVPLTDRNFNTGQKVADSVALVPIYYTLPQKLTSSDIASMFGVKIEQLEIYNTNLSPSLNAGDKVQVGHLAVLRTSRMHPNYTPPIIVEQVQTNAASEAVAVPDKAKEPQIVEVEVKNQTEKPVKKPTPNVEAPAPPSIEAQDVVVNEKKTSKDKKKKAEPESKEVKNITPTVVAEEPKPVEIADTNEGYFKIDFEQQEGSYTSQNGAAQVFKSITGKFDKKFYCLHNYAPKGSYVKVISKTTKKIAYAKVIDEVPEISINKGKIILISNSMAEALGETEDSFNVTVVLLQ